MAIESKNIIISFIIGLIVNLVSAYLFFYLKTINLNSFIFIMIVSILFIFIVITQLSNYEMEKRLNYHEQEYKKLKEKLKIHEQLIVIKSEINELKKKLE